MAKTVLIVEDNELNMKLFRDLLEAHGYHTSGTSNGFEALDLVRKLRPDLVLMDIQLPQVSGLDVTRWIKDDPELRAIPVAARVARPGWCDIGRYRHWPSPTSIATRSTQRSKSGTTRP